MFDQQSGSIKLGKKKNQTQDFNDKGQSPERCEQSPKKQHDK